MEVKIGDGKLGATMHMGGPNPLLIILVCGIILNHWFMETAQPHTQPVSSELCISLLDESEDT